MLLRITSIMIRNKRNVVKEDKCDKVRRKPRLLLIRLNHLLQLLQQLMPQPRLNLVNENHVELRPHNRRQRDPPVNRTRLVHDVQRHPQRLLPNDDSRLGRQPDRDPEPERQQEQLALVVRRVAVLRHLPREGVRLPEELVLRLQHRVEALQDTPVDMLRVRLSRRLKVDDGVRRDGDRLLDTVDNPRPLEFVAVLGDEPPDPELHGPAGVSLRDLDNLDVVRRPVRDVVYDAVPPSSRPLKAAHLAGLEQLDFGDLVPQTW